MAPDADLPDGEPQTWFKTAFRFRGVQVAADGELGFASEYDRQTRTERVFLVDVTDFDVAPVVGAAFGGFVYVFAFTARTRHDVSASEETHGLMVVILLNMLLAKFMAAYSEA